MSINVKNEVISGIKWNFIGEFGHYIIHFIVSLVLARLLTPEDFGLYGMLLIFTAISIVFMQSGLGAALIQKKDATNADFSTVFYYNVGVSVICYIILFFCAQLIADFYNQQELNRLIKLISIGLIFNSLCVVHTTILQKELNFKKLNIIKLIGIIISGIIAIVMAYMGFGVYAIIAQTISIAVINAFLYWVTSKWRPQLIFSKKSFKELFGFGSKLLLSSLLNTFYKNVDSLIIGKFFSPAQLGYFSRAKSTKDIPLSMTSGLLTTLVFPIFSKLDNDIQIKYYHLKFLSLVGYIIFPIMTGLAVVAEPLTVLLFTDKWLPSVPMLQILCISGPVYPLSVILGQAILAKGKSNIYLKIEIIKKIIGLTGMFIGIFYGFYGFLIGLTLSWFISLLIDFVYTGNLIDTRIIEYIKTLLPAFLLSLLMAVIIYFIKFLLPDNYFLLLVIQMTVGIIIYLSASYLLKLQDFVYLGNLIKEKIKK
jgi:O-antigen/teichoic acid export membrane protein